MICSKPPGDQIQGICSSLKRSVKVEYHRGLSAPGLHKLRYQRKQMIREQASQKRRRLRIANLAERGGNFVEYRLPCDWLELTGTAPSRLVHRISQPIRVVENMQARMAACAKLAPIEWVGWIAFNLPGAPVDHANDNSAASRTLATGACKPGGSTG